MPIPNIEDLIITVPLYENIKFESDDAEDIFKFLYFEGTLDSFCPLCNMNSTFRGVNGLTTDIQQGIPLKVPVVDYKSFLYHKFTMEMWLNKIHRVKLVCTRKPIHFIEVSYFFLNNIMYKIGQCPSIAALTLPSLQKYRRVLDAERFKELTRAIGLVTHGVGIGSFVYLRRIFETLIEEAHQKLLLSPGWDEEAYLKSRMDEKILLLQSELPEFLVENRKLYSILSIGIHNLEENKCLEYFPTVRLGIELILEEKLAAKIRQEKIDEAKKSIGKLVEDLSKA